MRNSEWGREKGKCGGGGSKGGHETMESSLVGVVVDIVVVAVAVRK